MSLYGAIFSFMTMRQYQQESNDAYLTCFKSNVETLKLAGGSHTLKSDDLINKPATNISDADRHNEKD